MAWGKLYKRSLFSGIDTVFPSIAFEDFATIPFFYIKANTISVVDTTYYIWRNRSNSLSHRIETLNDRPESMRVLLKRCKDVIRNDGELKCFKAFCKERIFTNERIAADELFTFQRQYLNIEKDIYHTAFEEEMSIPNLLLVGSYTVNVVGKLLGGNGMKQNAGNYYGFSSLIGMAKGGLPGWQFQSSNASNSFRKKAVVNELCKRLISLTKFELDDIDYILLDLMDERFDIGLNGDGTCFTISDAFLECLPEMNGEP